MNDPTITEALATPCRRCGGMPKMYDNGYGYYFTMCSVCGCVTFRSSKTELESARKWVEMNRKEVEDGKA